ncbi:MAG: hypothetical protein K6E22_14435 [Treponema sp.]|nr:hypothetical protein [Treponema sp.]
MAFGDDMIDGYAEGEEPLIFHHKRGEFRQLEDKKTRELAEGEGFKSKGFFGVLVGTKGNRMIFMALVVCMGLIFVLSILSGRKNEGVIDGVGCKMDSFSIEETVYVSVALKMTKSAREKADANRPRHFFAVVNALDANGELVSSSKEEYLFSLSQENEEQKKQFLRASFTDYDIDSIECILSLSDSTEGEGAVQPSRNEIKLKSKVSRH